MEIFNIIAGTASIISLIISIVSLMKVSDVQKMIKSEQNVSNNQISDNSKVTQIAGDYTKTKDNL